MRLLFDLHSLARLAAVVILTLALALPAAVRAETITVFAAASLKNAMDEIAAAFHAETGHDVQLSLAGSSVLARQIRQGAPADVFVSANALWMDVLDESGIIAPDTRFDLVGNSLVLIAHGRQAAPLHIGPGLDLGALLGKGHLAMALVDAVPAGIYGKSALVHLGLWDGVAPQVAQTDNVRAALALVASGEAPLGIVYATDAVAAGNVTVVGSFPADSHPPIIYPAAAVAGRDGAAISGFLSFLKGPDAGDALARQGFTLLAE